MSLTFKTIKYTMRSLQNAQILRPINTKIFLQVTEYSRWTNRKPAKIVNENELFVDSDERSASKNILKNAKFAFAQRQKLMLKKETDKDEALEKQSGNGTLNDDGTPIFTKLKKDDPLMSTLMILVKSKKKQKQDDRVLLEGYRLIEDAMKVGLVPEIIIFSRTLTLKRLPLPKEGVKLYKIPYQTIQLWSDLSTSPGIMGIFKTPDMSDKEPADNSLPVTIICDNVREPGNLGSILRVAAGVGCERVILSKGCVDLWSPKVLRSAAGAHFRLPIFRSQTWSEVQYLISENANIFVADNNVKPPIDPSENPEPDSSSSSSSDSDSDSESSDSEIKPDAEVKDLAKKIHEDFEEKSPKDSIDSEANEPKTEKLTFSEDEDNFQDSVESLPIIPYFSVQYKNTESVVIVGGETKGLSPESLALALRRDGVRVNVPLINGVESLNTGTALGIVLFEIKRQFLAKLNNF